jgi:hypothetical protein
MPRTTMTIPFPPPSGRSPEELLVLLLGSALGVFLWCLCLGVSHLGC